MSLEESDDYIFPGINEYHNYFQTFRELLEYEPLWDKSDTNVENNLKENELNILNKSNHSIVNNDLSLSKNYSFPNFEDIEKKPLTPKSTDNKNTKIILNKKESNKQKLTNKKTKRGRLAKNIIPSYKVKHDKFESLNIIQRIKNLFVGNLYDYINKKYKEYKIKNNQPIEPLLYKIDQSLYKANSKKKNQQFFSLKVRDLFSSDITERYSKFLRTNPKDHNKTQIDLLIKENKADEIIEIMNSTLEEMYEKFINNKLNGFNLKKSLNKIELEEGSIYANIFEEKAVNLIKITYNKGKHSNK